jgi:hypothetical protein
MNLPNKITSGVSRLLRLGKRTVHDERHIDIAELSDSLNTSKLPDPVTETQKEKLAKLKTELSAITDLTQKNDASEEDFFALDPVFSMDLSKFSKKSNTELDDYDSIDLDALEHLDEEEVPAYMIKFKRDEAEFQSTRTLKKPSFLNFIRDPKTAMLQLRHITPRLFAPKQDKYTTPFASGDTSKAYQEKLKRGVKDINFPSPSGSRTCWQKKIVFVSQLESPTIHITQPLSDNPEIRMQQIEEVTPKINTLQKLRNSINLFWNSSSNFVSDSIKNITGRRLALSLAAITTLAGLFASIDNKSSSTKPIQQPSDTTLETATTKLPSQLSPIQVIIPEIDQVKKLVPVSKIETKPRKVIQPSTAKPLAVSEVYKTLQASTTGLRVNKNGRPFITKQLKLQAEQLGGEISIRLKDKKGNIKTLKVNEAGMVNTSISNSSISQLQALVSTSNSKNNLITIIATAPLK